MSKTELSLPTLDKLGVGLPDIANIDIKAITIAWFTSFSQFVGANDIDGIVSLFLPDATWRDMLALTWNLRSFLGLESIKAFLHDRLAQTKLESLKLTEGELRPQLQQPYPDLLWIMAFFTFSTSVGHGTGIFRIVPTASGEWKAHAMYTNLEDLHGHPELSGSLRNAVPNHGSWPSERQREIDFADSEPTVIIVGGGQGGLEVAARLKYLGVAALVLEKNARVGDQWRGRYEALCLHDPVWYDHMPYIPFPPTWPVWTPAPKLADWLESYAHSLELNVWTSANIKHLSQDPTTKEWTVIVTRGDSGERTFRVKYVVIAVGLAGGIPNMPDIPGKDQFKGKIIHSTEHKSARDHISKKVVVVGACTSGHDVAADHHKHGVDVTLYQRSSSYIMSTKEGMPRLLGGLYWEGSPPTDVADRINASFPNAIVKQLHKRVTADIAEADKELLDGLRRVGFRLNFGEDDSGFLLQAWKRGGGYYLDVGASQLIIDGKIKLKNDSPISSFTPDGLKFKNGSEIPADVVIFATGLGDARESVRKLCGDGIADKLKQVWGLDEEGELNSIWRDSGVEGLYWMMGNLHLCRFHSKHVALQILAQEKGFFSTRYEAA